MQATLLIPKDIKCKISVGLWKEPVVICIGGLARRELEGGSKRGHYSDHKYLYSVAEAWGCQIEMLRVGAPCNFIPV